MARHPRVRLKNSSLQPHSRLSRTAGHLTAHVTTATLSGAAAAHAHQMTDLDAAIQRINQDVPHHPSAIQLTGVYQNLLRQWAEI